MKFEWLVARRYLRSPHRPAVLRLVTLLSVVGVAAGVATLVIALSMNSGFRETLQDRLLGVTAHITLSEPAADGLHDYQALASRLAKIPGVRSATPAIYETVLLSASTPSGIELKGVDPRLEKKSNEALNHIVEGRADFSPDSDGIGAIILGRLLAEKSKLHAGDYVTLISPEGRLTPYGMVPRSMRFRVTGIFDSGFYDFDANWGFATLASAQSLAGVGDEASVIEFRIAHLDQAASLANELARAAGPGYKASTWQDENRALFRALSLEKLVTAIFIGLITFVAGLNILVVLTMSVTDRARDIAVLMSMGARRKQLRGVFFLQGLAIGALGTAAGLAVGYLAAWIAGTYLHIPLDPEVYSIPFVPFHPNGFDAIWIAVAALAICAAATFVPARAAARLLPVEILRYE
ncbi:MAG TPA: ABC transporter permease [Candidatus Acidoferrales bacterium]|jgi:lipoprotein-releasing system permease protein|nr:ABC transporter permease [Candidatus Acidoferrales bacterium]